MESGRKKYLKNFIVLIDNTLMRHIILRQIDGIRLKVILKVKKYCSLQQLLLGTMVKSWMEI